MIYRIHFETNGSYWCIQFKKLFGWVSAKSIEDKASGKKKLQVKSFESFEDASAYAVSSGIDQAYTKRANTVTPYSPISSGTRDFPVPDGYRLVPTN